MVEIELFPTQTESDGLFAIVITSSGVKFINQVGGTACGQMEAEGFLVPVGQPFHLKLVKDWFHRRFGASCWADGRLAASPEWVDELAEIVAKIPCWVEGKPIPLVLDKERLAQGCEAWLPVITF